MTFISPTLLASVLTATCMGETMQLHTTAALDTADSGAKLYFYQPDVCGSEATFNPLTVMVNGAFDILRQPAYTKQPADVHWRQGFKNVFRNVSRPDETIERTGGWRSFVAHEVFPYRGMGDGQVQFLPNYALHVLGEGMVNRKLAEWYEVNGFPAPMLWAIATSFTTLMLNEAAENGAYAGPNRDPVADILIFNPLGWILFALDPVAEFFSGPVRIAYWPGQAVLGVPTGNIINAGENYVLKIDIGEWSPVDLFAGFGYGAMFGLSLPIGEYGTVSAGFGPRMINLVASPSAEGRVIAADGRTNWELSLFWDVGDSLMASMDVGGMEDPLIRVNVYPGVVELFGSRVGAYLVAGRYDGFAVGLTLSVLPIVPNVSLPGDDRLVRL